MTLGERIAALRKETGLSQEKLGELVGVTRQAVSRWESDRAVPDVNNCVAMSRVFGIPLARLLEIEEGAETPELSPAHVELLERLTEQYAAAQRRVRRRWRWPLILLACGLIVGAAWLWEWLNDMNRRVDYLSGELSGLQGEIVSGVGDRVQESLEAERSLITDHTLEVVSADVVENTVTYQVTANLKEATPETAVSLMVRWGSQVATAPMTRGDGLSCSGEIVCPIQDGAAVYLVAEEGAESRSQLLENVLPESDYAIRASGDVRWAALQQSGLTEGAFEPVELYVFLCEGPGLESPLALTDLELVTFRNDRPVSALPVDLARGQRAGGEWHIHSELDIPVEGDFRPGDTVSFALMARDNYGREASALISRYRVLEAGTLEALAHERLDLDDGTYGTEVWT